MSRRWTLRRRARKVIVEPLREFLHAESTGGIVLLIAAVVAMVWANSPASGTYQALWNTELTLGTGPLAPSHDLRGWVNDGLMVLFFFVIGLEIKRELITGELREPRVAVLPALAAAGGVVFPALIFFGIVGTGEGAAGWGIPVATDIAFAVGVLAVLGSRIPAGWSRSGRSPRACHWRRMSPRATDTATPVSRSMPGQPCSDRRTGHPTRPTGCER